MKFLSFNKYWCVVFVVCVSVFKAYVIVSKQEINRRKLKRKQNSNTFTQPIANRTLLWMCVRVCVIRTKRQTERKQRMSCNFQQFCVVIVFATFINAAGISAQRFVHTRRNVLKMLLKTTDNRRLVAKAHFLLFCQAEYLHTKWGLFSFSALTPRFSYLFAMVEKFITFFKGAHICFCYATKSESNFPWVDFFLFS